MTTDEITKFALQADAYADAMDIGGKNHIGLRDEYFAALVRNAVLEECASERDALEARAERLAEALRRYGVHDEACTAWDIPICTCGLDAALEQENSND